MVHQWLHSVSVDDLKPYTVSSSNVNLRIERIPLKVTNSGDSSCSYANRERRLRPYALDTTALKQQQPTQAQPIQPTLIAPVATGGGGMSRAEFEKLSTEGLIAWLATKEVVLSDQVQSIFRDQEIDGDGLTGLTIVDLERNGIPSGVAAKIMKDSTVIGSFFSEFLLPVCMTPLVIKKDRRQKTPSSPSFSLSFYLSFPLYFLFHGRQRTCRHRSRRRRRRQRRQ